MTDDCMDKNVLEIRDLKVEFKTEEGMLRAVDGVSFSMERGRTLGLVGESGCGKSVTSQALLRLVPPNGTVSGTILLNRRAGHPVDIGALESGGPELRALRGKDISIIFQEPMTSFSPLYTMGNQLMEAIMLHGTRNKAEARRSAVELLRKVGIANPEKRIDEYPHEFSGGMRQRVMIAMALCGEPDVLIADEPTTALDVTIQAQVLELMKELQESFGMSILFITHDLGVVAEMCDNVCVMYLGKIVEQAPVDDIFHKPAHPYTRGLLQSVPRIGRKSEEPLECIEGVVPIPLDPPPMCGFHERCGRRIEGLCESHDVPMAEIAPGHFVRCFLYPEVMERHNS